MHDQAVTTTNVLRRQSLPLLPGPAYLPRDETRQDRPAHPSSPKSPPTQSNQHRQLDINHLGNLVYTVSLEIVNSLARGEAELRQC